MENKETDRLSEEGKKENAKNEKNMKSELAEWAKDIAGALVLVFIITRFIMPTVVNQHSMENTLMPRDYVFVSKKAYKWFGEPKRGDIIVFQSDLPLDGKKGNKLLVKRIIGLGGDSIAIKDGKVFVNGEELEEDYIKDGTTNGEMETVVPEGYLFCMGDNRLVSLDSRDPSVGFVDEESVKGKVVFRLYPFGSMGSVYNKTQQK